MWHRAVRCWYPAFDHVSDEEGNNRCDIIRFENLNEEFEQLIEDWHLPKIKLSRSNKSRRLRKPFKYELRLGKRFIERFYRDDFKIFSYKK